MVHNFNPILVDFGLFQVKWYSLAYIFGIILGWMYATKIIQYNQKNKHYTNLITKQQFEDLIIYLLFGIIIGGRLGYILFYNLEYFSKNFFDIFKLWEGGMSFHGGMLGVIVATIIFSQKVKNNFFQFTDIISCVAPIGIFLGRIANFINGELYGKISTLPWAIIYPYEENFGRHPSQIYEAILEGLVLFILINFFAFKKKLLFKTGYVSAFFLILYSILRIIGLIFREPDKHIGYFFNYFSLGVILSFVTIVVGVFIIIFLKKNEQNN